MDESWGVRKPSIKRVSVDQKVLSKELGVCTRKLLSISEKEFLAFSQNATTSLIYSLLPILTSKKYKVFISSHEIIWLRTLFSSGKLPGKKTTYPNYAKLKNIKFLKQSFQVFDPLALLDNPKKIIGSDPCVLILSHISRMTGEIFASSRVYSEIKGLNKDNIVVIDGCQAVGAIPVRPSHLSDIYLGVTSKFIGAEPHIGFCWVRQEIVRNFDIKPWTIDPIYFIKEIYSAVQSLKKLNIISKKVLTIRTMFKRYLEKYDIRVLETKNQASHIVIIPTKKSLDELIDYIRQRGYKVSSNTGWSIVQPTIPGIRVSLTLKTSDTQIKKLANILGSMKNSGLL